MRRILFLGLIGLSACSQDQGRYPSLMPRPIESRTWAEPVRTPPSVTADPALDAQIKALGAKTEAAYKGFVETAQRAEARVAVARGTAQGSEAWLNAQVALAEVDAALEPLSAAVSDLETAAIDRGTSGQPDYPALNAALQAARTQLEQANARSASLDAALSGR